MNIKPKIKDLGYVIKFSYYYSRMSIEYLLFKRFRKHAGHNFARRLSLVLLKYSFEELIK